MNLTLYPNPNHNLNNNSNPANAGHLINLLCLRTIVLSANDHFLVSDNTYGIWPISLLFHANLFFLAGTRVPPDAPCAKISEKY